MAFELVSFKSLQALLKLEEDDIEEYPALALIKESVFYAIEDELGRMLEKQDHVETYQVGTTLTRYIDLVGLPISSVSEVLVDGIALDSDEYAICKSGLRLITGVKEVDVQVTYNGGYETVPKGLERAALLQTSYEFQNKDHIGASSVDTEGGSVQIPALQLLPIVKKILNIHKHPTRIS